MKYVVVAINGIEVVTVFQELVTHLGVAEGILSRERRIGNEARLVSAGFCAFGVNAAGQIVARVWGESESCQMDSRPEDAVLLGIAMRAQFVPELVS